MRRDILDLDYFATFPSYSDRASDRALAIFYRPPSQAAAAPLHLLDREYLPTTGFAEPDAEPGD